MTLATALVIIGIVLICTALHLNDDIRPADPDLDKIMICIFGGAGIVLFMVGIDMDRGNWYLPVIGLIIAVGFEKVLAPRHKHRIRRLNQHRPHRPRPEAPISSKSDNKSKSAT